MKLELVHPSRIAAAEFDIFGLADRHGLKPVRAGGRVRFYCPQCDNERNRRRGRTASAAPNEEHQPWHCWRMSCGASGTSASLAEMLGEKEPAKEVEYRPSIPPKAPVPEDPNRIDIDRAWGDILGSSSAEGFEEICTWARGRGWPEDVVQAVVLSDEVTSVSMSRTTGREGRRLARLIEKSGRPIAVPIRDARGVVRQIARRWNGTGESPRPKSMSLPAAVTGAGDEWGGVWVYGSMPAAVSAATREETLVIVEGAPDYLAAYGVMAAAGEPCAVLGLYSTSTAEKAIKAFVKMLGEQNAIAPRVVIVSHNDTLSSEEIARGETVPVGMRTSLKLAAALRGRAGVFIAEFPKKHDDLSDMLSRDGTGSVLALLRTARCEYPRPVQLRNAPDEMSARFKRVVIEATSPSSLKKHTLVVFEVPPGVGKSFEALKAAAQIITGEFQIPVNGRRPRGVPEERWPPPERSVVFATPDHGLGDEKVDELAELAPGTRARHIHGLLHYCMFSSNVDEVYRSVGRRGVCGVDHPDEGQRCPHALSCPGARPPEAFRGEITFAPHALLPSIKADLVIVDESPGVVSTDVVTADQVVSLFACKLIPRVLNWVRYANHAAGDAARSLAETVSTMAYSHAAKASAGEVEPYSRRIWGDELRELLDSKPGLVADMAEGFRKDAPPPPVPSPAQARGGAHAANNMPSRPAFNAMRKLFEYYQRLVEDQKKATSPFEDDMSQPGHVCAIRLDTNGSWVIETRSVRKIPNAPVVVLDATGDLTIAEWEAAYPDRRVVIRSFDVQGAAPAKAVHINSAYFTRRALLGGDGGIRKDAVPRVANVIEELARLARLARPKFEGAAPPRIGVLTHKPIADAMAGCGDSAIIGGGPALRKCVEALIARGFSFESQTGASLFGWFGRHDRGTNAFDGVDGFAVIGDPFGNLGDIDADAFMLGLKAETIAEARAAATCRQAIARARHIRRNPDDRVVLVFAGREPPDVPGVAWSESKSRGGANVAESTKTLVDLCLHIASTTGALGIPVLERFDRRGTQWENFNPTSVPATRRRRIVEQTIRAIGWIPYPINATYGRVKIGSDSKEHAVLWSVASGVADPEKPGRINF